MLSKLLIALTKIRFSAVLCCAFIICILSFDCAAQSKQRHRKTDVLPRVGTIKDYPATGLMTGCANLYFYPGTQAPPSNAAYVFLARGDGSNAWMNLNGRDVRLQQVRMLTPKNLLTSENRKLHRYYYRLGKVHINVVIEDFKPENAPFNERDPVLKMKIIIRQGRAIRIVRAVGDADC